MVHILGDTWSVKPKKFKETKNLWLQEFNWDLRTWGTGILRIFGQSWMQVDWKITWFVKSNFFLKKVEKWRELISWCHGISEFSGELLFSHCKRDFHWLLANYLFFLYLLFRLWLECLMKCPSINLIIARINFFFTKNKKFRRSSWYMVSLFILWLFVLFLLFHYFHKCNHLLSTQTVWT